MTKMRKKHKSLIAIRMIFLLAISFLFIVYLAASTGVTLVPAPTTQVTVSGAITENKWDGFTTGTELTGACYALINVSGGATQCQATEGLVTLDAYIWWNVTLPSYQSINWIHFTAVLQKYSKGSSSADNINISIFNYTKNNWTYVNGSTTPTPGLNITLTYNLTGGIADYVQNNIVRFMARTYGLDSDDLSSDYMQAVFDYTSDTTSPNVNKVSPVNNTYNNATIYLNVTVNEAVSWCNYTFSAIGYNYSMTAKNTSYYFTSNTSVPDGSHTIRFNCSDTVGNINDTESVTFLLDTIKPAISIIHPTNTTYNVNISNLNYTYTDTNPGSCIYSRNRGITNSTSVLAGINFTNVPSIENGNNYTLFCNDTANNINTTWLYFTKDTIKPLGIIITPTNTTYNVNISNLNYTYFDTNPSSCWYSRDIGITNSTAVTAGINWSNVPSIEGSNNYTLFCNDSINNINMTTTYFYKDTIKPLGIIITPTNTTYNVNISNLNYTYTDTDPDSCWYSKDRGAVNSTSALAGINFSNVPSIEGSNNYTLFCNDTSNNLNSTWLYFTKDTIQPAISIITPTNTTYNVNVSNLNYTYSDTTPGSCWYSRDRGAVNSTSKLAGINFSNVPSIEGSNNYTLFCNDSINNINMTTKYFYKDTIQPAITIITPTNTTYNVNISNLNYTYTDTDPDSCWYSRNRGVSNSSSVLAGINFSNVPSIENGNNYTLFCNDTSNNLNSTFLYFTKDTIKPLGIIITPTNTTYNVNISNLNYTYFDTNPSSCWYSRDIGITNSTAVTAGINWSNVPSIEGSNNYTLFCNDSINNINITTTYFYKDTIKPLGIIITPANTTYNVNISNLNYTYLDTDPGSCWYSKDRGAVNSTSALAGVNFSNVPSIEGSNNYTLYCNDTSNNLNSTWLYFTKDTIQPALSIITPTNTTYNINISNLNYTYSDTTPGSCWYSLNIGITNSTSVLAGVNFSNVPSIEGSNNYTLFCNDSINNINITTKYFYKDTIKPLGIIITPANTTYNVNISNLNYTYLDTDPGSCWYSKDRGAVNSTSALAGVNFSNVPSIEGSNNYTLYCNDTSNNLNSTWLYFYKDTIAPAIATIHPANQTYNVNISNLNFTVGDANLQICRWSRDTGATYTTITCGNNVSNMISVEGNNTYTVWANDTSGNINTTNVTFFKDTVKPVPTIIFPTNVTYNINVSTFNYTYSDLNPGSCIYSRDMGIINSTSVLAGINFTTITSIEGSNNWTIFCNDTSNNINTTFIYFYKDTIQPAIAIINPTNTTYNVNVSNLNYTYTDTDPGSCIYSRDRGITNSTSVLAGINFSNVPSIEGSNNYTLYCNDTSNNLNSTWLYFYKDTISPYFTTIPVGEEVVYGIAWAGVQFEADDETKFDSYSINDTINFVINSTGFLNWTGQLGVGNYYINITINDTANNINSTIYNLNITKASLSGNLINNTNLTLIYPNPFNWTYSESNTGDSDITYSVFREGINVTDENNSDIVLGVGNYDYILNSTGGANYSANSSIENFTVIINQATGIINGTINETQGNFSATNGTANQNIYVNATNITGYGTGKIYVNGTLINSGTLPLFNVTNLSMGFYNITFEYDGNENYTGASETWWINITEGVAIHQQAWLKSPTNGTILATKTVYFEGNFTNDALSNTTVYIWNSTLDIINNTETRTITGTTNVTNISIILPYDGTFFWNYYVCDIANNCAYNSTNWTFIIDTTFPVIAIIYPANISYNINVSELNYTISDTNLQSCWYSTDDGTTNTSITCGNNKTGLTSTEGSNIWLVGANDTANNINTSRVTFYKETNSSVTMCRTLDLANTIYTLLNNVTSTGTCFTIGANNVTLDCQGYTINYSSSGTVGYGVYSESRGNTTIKNCVIKEGVATGNTKYAIYFNSVGNGIINNNTITTIGNSLGHGIIFISSSANTLSNNTITTYGGSGHGIYLYSSSANILSNNTITTYGGSGHGIYFQLASNSNIFSEMNIKTNNTGNAFYIYDAAHNFTISDSILNSSKSGIVDFYVAGGANGGTWNFTNVTRANGAAITKTWTAGANGTLNMMWYLEINITNSSGALTGANVSAWDVNNLEQFSELTDTAGNIVKKTLLEYKQNNTSGATTTYYTYHIINVTKSLYITNSTTYNLTTAHNIFHQVIMQESVAPTIAIIHPTNISYNVNVSNLNYTYSDDNPASCWYSRDMGTTNSTSILAGINFTNTISIEGSNNYTLFCNDSINNINMTTTYFYKDTIQPAIAIIHPTNTTYNINISNLNFTVGDANLQICRWSRDTGATYTTITCGNNVSNMISVEGNNTYTVWANDTSGNINTTNVTFFKDTIQPGISIKYPTNISYNINISAMNYTYSDLNPGSCIYSRNRGITNSTSVLSGINFTIITSIEGSNNWTIFCNDTSNNINSTFIYFYKDTINPQIKTVYPTNTSYTSNITGLNYIISDINFDSCWYSLDVGENNNSITCGINITGINSTEGNNTWIIWANDTLNNINFSLVNFYVNTSIEDNISPNITIIYPTNNSYFALFEINISLNVSAWDENNISSYWWSYDTGIHNYSFTPNTTMSWDQPARTTYVYNITVWANDTYNNIAFNISTITIYTTNPGGVIPGDGGGTVITPNITNITEIEIKNETIKISFIIKNIGSALYKIGKIICPSNPIKIGLPVFFFGIFTIVILYSNYRKKYKIKKEKPVNVTINYPSKKKKQWRTYAK